MSQVSTLANLGESESLRRTIGRLIRGDFTALGPGDDAALVLAPDSRYVVTTDTMIEGYDFRLEWSTGFDLGFKAVATNLADVAAMGARPTAILVAIALPGTTEIHWLEGFADGLNAALEQLAPGAGVVGGDLAQSEKVFIAVTAQGDLQGREPILRSSAKPGDVLAVAGTLGRAAAGLSILNSGIADVIRAFDDLVGIQLRPQPPVAAGIAAALAGARAMLDVSDGLSVDAHRLAMASGVSIELSSRELQGYEATLEQAAMRLGMSSLDWVLHGGEDHALLASFPAGSTLPKEFKPIGHVSAKGDAPLRLDGVEISSKGWDSIRG